MVPLSELMLREYQALREELHDLKQCQVRFLTISVTATGALLSLATGLAKGVPIAYLFPLAILIPCWMIFFDKATTITRIVGYFRQLEKMMRDPNLSKRYIGWENSLAKYRELQQKGQLRKIRINIANTKVKEVNSNSTPNDFNRGTYKKFKDKPHFTVTHMYWMYNYLTFFMLTGFCWGIALYKVHKSGYKGAALAAFVISGIIVAVAAIVNLILIFRLIRGRYSYSSNEEIWNAILDLIRLKTLFRNESEIFS